ncbi:MAG: mechanosensitive ion channel family protein [Gemmatimonadales bacterium]|jgi:small-conductance mechanosensitive channel
MSEFFENVVWGNTVGRWLAAVGITVVVYAALWLLVRIGVRRLGDLSTRTKTEIDDLVTGILEKSRPTILLVIAAYAGTLSLSLPPRLASLFGHAAFVVAALQVGIWLSAALSSTIDLQRKRAIAEDPGSATGMRVVGYIGKAVIWVLVLLSVADNVGVDVTALVASLGVGGIAIALAVQSILGDVFASLSIIFDKPFLIGDFVRVGDYTGSVENIGIKTTRLRSLSGEQLVISNSDMLGSRIQNYGRMYERRASFTLGVTYDTPREKLARIPDMVREAIEAQEDVRFDRAHFKEFGAYSLNIDAVYYVLSPEYARYMDIQQRINLEISRRFEEEAIDFAYPTQVVHVNPAQGGSEALAG